MIVSRSPNGDLQAFHTQIGVINRRRIVPLALVTAALLGLAAGLNLASGSPLAAPVVRQNLGGVMLCILVLAAARWSRHPGLSAVLYGYSVLAWGNTVIATYLTEVGVGHAAHAAQQFVVFFITRYLAAMSVVWRPRTLAFALLINHLFAMWPLLPRGILDALLFPGIWTATAWLVAYMIYRAERDAFVARRSLQNQRDALAAANARLELLNQEKNDLMAIAAHDLRSPLMGMTTLLNLAAEDASRAWTAGVATLRAIEQSGRDMADLVTRVLDAHQADGATEQLTIRAGDISPVVADAIAAQQSLAQAKGIALRVQADRQCLAMHDPHALRRVIENLGSNAIKFSPAGSSVSVTVSPGENGDGPRIEVRDSGPGVSDDERPRLFRKFARLRAKPTAGESSSGLGLYIVKRLVDAMGGSIDVKNAVGGGASFTVTLCPQTPSGLPGSASH